MVACLSFLSRRPLPCRAGGGGAALVLAMVLMPLGGVLQTAWSAAPAPLPRERPAELSQGLATPVAPEPETAPPPDGSAIPLPPPRPSEFGQAPEATPAASPAETRPPDASPPQAECLDTLRQAGAKAEPVPPLASGTCGVASPLRLTALPDGVTLKPAAVVNCAVATTLLDFMGRDVATAARERLASRVTAIAVATSYDCRPQNHVSGAKMSEHGLGNAIDIAGFTLAGGRTVTIGDPKADASASDFVADIRKASCERFTTVLGPGSDAEHGNHLHLDLRQRSHNYRICQ